ncbi:tetratricopeptide repeat protein [Micromonospora sp. NPDC047740]|uniref:tetratricopeptide repeat protein n=1 Tax=Micromonospora sp. NPDC047740 TaxID=3364254 RepID=UPI003713AA86
MPARPRPSPRRSGPTSWLATARLGPPRRRSSVSGLADRRPFLLAGNYSAGAEVLNGSGWYHALAGNLRQSLRQTRTALTLLQRFGDRHGEASAWDTLGRLCSRLGDRGQADRCYEHALALFRDLGDQFFEAEVLIHRAEDRWAVGDQDAARADWDASARILAGLHHPWAAIVRDRIDQAGGVCPGAKFVRGVTRPATCWPVTLTCGKGWS